MIQRTESKQDQLLQPGLSDVFSAHQNWASFMPPFDIDESTIVDSAFFKTIYKTFTDRLSDNYPFFHPLYAGQMLKPPHPVAVLGYLTAMLINPNNHALDGGPATAKMEKEAVAELAKSFGFEQHLGHLTSGGTIANLEALWVARQLHPQKSIAVSSQAHYTHKRIGGEVLQANIVSIPSLPNGCIDLENLETHLINHPNTIGTVVATLGTTGLGALDDLEKLVTLKQKYGFRIHVDMAYGGYYHLLAECDPDFSVFKFLKDADSIVIDPHKHGLQPYGCGCIIFSDPSVGQLYQHDSPYTYFSSDELHLGEISLECSRPGATAAALWLTMQCFPLESETGMGAIIKQCRSAALDLANRIEQSPHYQLYLEPQTDIVTYFFKRKTAKEVSRYSKLIFFNAMANVDYPLYLATLNVPVAEFSALHPDIEIDAESQEKGTVMILRSCLLKPEHQQWTQQIMQILEHHAQLLQS